MFKYVATAATAVLLLAVALKSRDAGTPAPLAVSHGTPDRVQVERVADGFSLVVAHRLAGSVSRAALVYEDAEGKARTAAQDADCERSLATPGAALDDDGYATEITLKAVLPPDAHHVRLVVEDETGTRVFPVTLE